MSNKIETKMYTSEEMITAAIDGIIALFHLASEKIIEVEKENGGECTSEIIEALRDLTQDDRVLFVLRYHPSRHIISEERAKVFDVIIDSQKK